MYYTLISATIALALSSTARAAPIEDRQATDLIHADTVQFIAKTVGQNPNPAYLPDVNNWLAIPLHSGAIENIFTLQNPSVYLGQLDNTFNLSAPGYFRNGSNHWDMYITGGNLFSGDSLPFGIVFDMGHDNSSSNPGAQSGIVEYNGGIGTDGVDVMYGYLVVTYAYDVFYACPNFFFESGVQIVIGVTNRYADPLAGCWEIYLFAQCAGNITDSDRAAYPYFQQAGCHANATAAPLVFQ